MTAAPTHEDRIVLLAPSARDGPVTSRVLANAGFECVLARDGADLCRLLEEAAAAALVSEEALDRDTSRRIADLVRAQPTWSDLPVLILTTHSSRRAGRLADLEKLAPFGNVTLLDRPVEVITLVSAVRAALRTRHRQYGARASLEEMWRMQEEVRASEARFRTMADGTPLMIWMTDATGGVEFVNRAYREFFGVTLESVQAGGWQPLVHPEDAASYVGAYARAAEGRTPFRAEARVRRADGAWRWVESTGVPRASPSGAFLGFVGSSPDVTERKEVEQSLREADRQKTEFLGVLSHELRNPLAPIRNSVFLLARAPPASEQALRARQVIERQTAHLARLVDDLLDVTRIERGKIELRRERVDAREIVRRACEDHRDFFEARGVELDLHLSRPTWIDADVTRIAQLVGNLLQNAAKFSSAGQKVSVSVSASGTSAEISVRDEGVGIAPDLLPRLFNPFVQADGGLSRLQGGLGLGLSLVKGLVELHGGTVTARSDGVGKGAELVVQLPLAVARPAASDDPGRKPPARPSLRVLVVDDNADGAQTLADVLHLRGHSAEVATDGRTGLAKVRQAPFDVVLCDIGLPDVDGYEVARTLRADGALKRLRLVALTGYAQPEDRRRAAAAGFDAHLAKPPDLEALLRAIEGDARPDTGSAEGHRSIGSTP